MRRLRLIPCVGGDSFQASKNAHQGGGATVKAIERGLEHLRGLIERIYDRATRIELRIEIAGNHNSPASDREQTRYPAGLIGIHHDYEISVVEC